MPETIMRSYGIQHPAPHGRSVSMGLVWAGLLAAPAAWSLQLLVSYGLASHACFPRDYLYARVVPGWGWIMPALVAINIAALAVACIGTAISYRNWSRISQEASGGHTRLLEAGEGRTRFLAVWGIWSGIWFAIAIVFDTIAVFAVPLCGS
ncbi:hypothetical protein [Microvirga sp. M2]|uniref:hypothetical protein n=1 Tax=Microvirga sp. M2 TaxID=3073270 RepID=UPI0039C41AF3